MTGESYRGQVALALIICQRLASLSGEEFARQLGEEVGQKVSPSQLSAYQNRRVTPGAHILVAALQLAGFPLLPTLTGARIDAAEREVQEVEERKRQQQKREK